MAYTSQYGKSYNTLEEIERRAAIFFEKDKFINERNSLAGAIVVNHNKFSDWTKEEFSGILGANNK